MASASLRLGRTLRTLSSLHRPFSAVSATSASPFPATTRHAASSTPLSSLSPTYLVPSRAFRSSSISLLSARSSPTNNPDEIGPDTILFEGCDYNHWLIVMDFPKDNKPTPQQMVETYEQTCAKGLNISVEEAKKKMYACSTTTYTGFQAVMTEEESEKFNGLPGVIFVLPDSYIDPVNKEYGGDKYINGTIIPRPPPIQYGRSQGRRDRNRNPDQPRYNQQGNYQGSMQGDGRNYGASQNYPPQQNYGPPSQSYPQQQNYGPPPHQHAPQQQYSPASPQHAPQQQYSPASSQYAPQQQYSPASPQHAPQQQYGARQPRQQNFGPPGQGMGRGPVPRHGGTGGYQGQRESFGPSNTEGFKPSYMEEFEQGSQQRYPPSGQGNFAGDNRNYGPPQSGNYGQGGGYQGGAGINGQGTHPGYGQNFPGQREQRNAQGEQRNYPPTGQTGTEQVNHFSYRN